MQTHSHGRPIGIPVGEHGDSPCLKKLILAGNPSSSVLVLAVKNYSGVSGVPRFSFWGNLTKQQACHKNK